MPVTALLHHPTPLYPPLGDVPTCRLSLLSSPLLSASAISRVGLRTESALLYMQKVCIVTPHTCSATQT